MSDNNVPRQSVSQSRFVCFVIACFAVPVFLSIVYQLAPRAENNSEEQRRILNEDAINVAAIKTSLMTSDPERYKGLVRLDHLIHCLKRLKIVFSAEDRASVVMNRDGRLESFKQQVAEKDYVRYGLTKEMLTAFEKYDPTNAKTPFPELPYPWNKKAENPYK